MRPCAYKNYDLVTVTPTLITLVRLNRLSLVKATNKLDSLENYRKKPTFSPPRNRAEKGSNCKVRGGKGSFGDHFNYSNGNYQGVVESHRKLHSLSKLHRFVIFLASEEA